MAKYIAWITALVLSFASASFAAQSTPHSPTVRAATPPDSDAARQIAQVYEMAARYEHGDGVLQSFEHARALYCEAARGGEARAFFALAWIYLNGRGVSRDDTIAVAWLKKAAERGVVQAANLLRLMPNVSAADHFGCSLATAARIAAPARIRDLIATTARELGIDAQLVTAVIAVESAFNPRAISPKNAQGLMQLMPETALRFGVRDPFDEKENVRGGATYLRDLLKRYGGDLTLALAAYNAGEGAILVNGGVPPYQETRDYIKRVTSLCACSGAEIEF